MRITQLTLDTHLLLAQKDFYTRQLQFDLVTEEADFFTLRAGGTQLTFRNAKGEQKPFYHFAFNIPENQMEEALQWAKERVQIVQWKGIEVHDFHNWNAHAFYFFDPAGNIVEFIARHDLSNEATTAFQATSITEVSEIGFVVPEIAPFFEKVQHHLGIPLYSGNLTTFCAAGDPNGLFIIVPKDRLWFPVDIPNGVFPTEVQHASNQPAWEANGLPYSIDTVRI
ncbi:MAG: VOC family protein [Thermonemataceae bacterium]